MLVGLGVPVTITVVYGIVEGLAFGAFAALGAAVAGGLLAGDHHAWLAYLAAVGTLSRRRLLPRKLMPFLDDAHRLGLLRAAGSVYQFRHAGLQDYLARTYRRQGATPGPVPAPRVRAELDWARGAGGRVPAWNSPGRSGKGP